MDLDLGAEERALRDTVRSMARRVGQDATGDDWWRVLAESGFLEMRVEGPGSALHAAVVCEAMGESVAPLHLPSYLTISACLADQLLGQLEWPEAAQDKSDGGWFRAFGIGYSHRRDGGIVELLDERPAYILLRVADGWALLPAEKFVEVGRSRWQSVPRQIEVTFDESQVSSVRGCRDWNELNILLHSAELVGVIREAIGRTIVYLREREQFGKPIGAFQALQHRTVDALTDLRAAESMVEYASWAWLDQACPTSSAWVHACAALVADSATRIMRECFQFHGGIAMTDEFWLHKWLRRATVLAAYQGAPEVHFAIVGQAVRSGTSLEVPLAPIGQVR